MDAAALTYSPTTDYVVVACGGEFTLATRDVLLRNLFRAARERPDHLVVDLTRVVFFDAGSMHLLDQVRDSLPPDVVWSLVCPPGPVRQGLRHHGITADHVVYDDLETAIHGARAS